MLQLNTTTKNNAITQKMLTTVFEQVKVFFFIFVLFELDFLAENTGKVGKIYKFILYIKLRCEYSKCANRLPEHDFGIIYIRSDNCYTSYFVKIWGNEKEYVYIYSVLWIL